MSKDNVETLIKDNDVVAMSLNPRPCRVMSAAHVPWQSVPRPT
jgi:hypothetical protein